MLNKSYENIYAQAVLFRRHGAETVALKHLSPLVEALPKYIEFLETDRGPIIIMEKIQCVPLLFVPKVKPRKGLGILIGVAEICQKIESEGLIY